MYCLANMCYVCLEKKDNSLININNSLLVNKDIIHIIGYLPFNLAWMKTKQIILICEECCLRLRQTYQFFAMCLKNSELLQRYKDNLKSTAISNTENEAVLTVTLDLNNIHEDVNEVNSEIKLEHEEMYADECGPIIEQSEDVFVNVEESFVKEEDTWKREEVDDTVESLMDNNFTENSDKETDSGISVHSSNTHDTAKDFDSSGFTRKQVPATNKKELKASAEKSYTCSTCSKSFIRKSDLERHTRVHTGEKPFKCSRCVKYFRQRSHVTRHMRVHTDDKETDSEMSVDSNTHDTDTDSDSSGFTRKHARSANKKKLKAAAEESYTCPTCSKSFIRKSDLERHTRVHTGEKPFKCSRCERYFRQRSHLTKHMRVHTGDKSNLGSHMQEPHKCSRCEKIFTQKSYVAIHMRIHTGEKPFECAECGKCFSSKVVLNRHKRVHTGEKPFKCSRCQKCFGFKCNLVSHMRTHTGT